MSADESAPDTSGPILKNILVRDIPLETYLKAVELKERLHCSDWTELFHKAMKSLEGGLDRA